MEKEEAHATIKNYIGEMKQRFIAFTLLAIACFMFSCTQTTTETEVSPVAVPPPFENMFNMVINGEDWITTVPEQFSNTTQYTVPLASITDRDSTSTINDSLFHISNFKHLLSVSISEIRSYYDFVAFFDEYIEGASEYPISYGEKIEGVERGFVYGEYVGGDDIIYYYPIEHPSNSFNVLFKRDEYGRRYVQGSFRFTALVDSARADSSYLPYRLKPDTVQITDGTFMLILNN